MIPAGFSCLLDEGHRVERAAAWRSLAPHVQGIAYTRGRFRIAFSLAALAHLEELVRAERTCCGWATWALTSTPRNAEVTVTGPSEEIAALAASFGW